MQAMSFLCVLPILPESGTPPDAGKRPPVGAVLALPTGRAAVRADETLWLPLPVQAVSTVICVVAP